MKFNLFLLGTTMKCSVVLLSFLITVVYSHPHSNSSGFPAIFWGGKRLIKSNFDVSEWWSTPNKVLECRTDLTTCCSDEQGFHRGDWFFPDGTQVQILEGNKGHVSQSQGDRGEYCCKVETVAEHRLNEKEALTGQRVCIDIINGTGKRHLLYLLHWLMCFGELTSEA